MKYFLSIAIALASFTQVLFPQSVSDCKLYELSPQAASTTPGTSVLVLGQGFPPDSNVYFGGFAARQTTFHDSSYLEAVTPYLRPGEYDIRITSGGVGGQAVGTGVSFTSLPGPVDSKIDSALEQARMGKVSEALEALEAIATTDEDYQVRAFAYYQKSRLYFMEGDWLKWCDEAAGIYLSADRSGMSVQTYWPYRLAYAQAHYFWIRDGDPRNDLDLHDYVILMDVTGAPEPRFSRALLCARTGDQTKARSDIDYCLNARPENSVYLGLAAFCAAMAEDKPRADGLAARALALLGQVEEKTENDATALTLLGEAAYVAGDTAKAQERWAEAGRVYRLGAGLALLAAKKHVWRGEPRIATMLLSETIAMAPHSEDAEGARKLLESIPK